MFPKPKLKSYLIASLVVAVFFFGLPFSILSDPINRQSFNRGNGDPVFQSILCIIIGFIVLIVIWHLYRWSLHRHRLSVEHPEEYESLRQAELSKYNEQQRKAKAAEEIRLSQMPACPVCGNRDIKRISTADRTTSIALFGLASSKIGKQYQCKNCKHMW